FAGRSGGAGWGDTVAGVPSGAAAAVGADSGGGVYPVVYRRHHRSPGRLTATARCEQLHPCRRYAAVPQPAKLPVGRLCRGGRPLCHPDYRGVPAGPALAGQRPDGGRCERLSFICYATATLNFRRIVLNQLVTVIRRPPGRHFFYSRFSRFELHSQRVITSSRIAAE